MEALKRLIRAIREWLLSEEPASRREQPSESTAEQITSYRVIRNALLVR